MTAPDLPLLSTVSRPTIHPDGSRVVFSVIRADVAADDYLGQLWTVALRGTPSPRRLTRGHRDAAPRFSPDGRLLAFPRATPHTGCERRARKAAVGAVRTPTLVMHFGTRPAAPAVPGGAPLFLAPARGSAR